MQSSVTRTVRIRTGYALVAAASLAAALGGLSRWFFALGAAGASAFAASYGKAGWFFQAGSSDSEHEGHKTGIGRQPASGTPSLSGRIARALRPRYAIEWVCTGLLAIVSIAVLAGAATSDHVDPFGLAVMGGLGAYFSLSGWRTLQRSPNDLRDRLLFLAGAQLILVAALGSLILIARA